MEQARRVEAVSYLRKMRGGAQPILIEANDGLLYVTKFHNNLQGSNLLFNEAMGSEVFRSAGLPVPEWRIVDLSEEFVARNPGCWMQTERGTRKPKAGMCFGSQYLGLSDGPVYEILTSGQFNRVQNRVNFWTAWFLDVLCDHADNRQAVFQERIDRRLDAYFIDHGHMFGGAHGTVTSHFQTSRYLDRRVYTEADAQVATEVAKAIRKMDGASLNAVRESLPKEWKSASASLRWQSFASRLGDRVLLERIMGFLLGRQEVAERSNEVQRAQGGIGGECASLFAPLSPSRGKDRLRRRRSDSGCDPGRIPPQAVYAPWATAAGF